MNKKLINARVNKVLVVYDLLKTLSEREKR